MSTVTWTGSDDGAIAASPARHLVRTVCPGCRDHVPAAVAVLRGRAREEAQQFNEFRDGLLITDLAHRVHYSLVMRVLRSDPLR
jgi:hypothetical protein